MTDVVHRSLSSSILRHLRNRLISGLLVLVPLAITLFIINIFFTAFSGFVLPILRPVLGGVPAVVLTVIAIVLTALFIYAVGVVATHIAGQRLISLGERLLLKLPVVKSIYGASKQVVDTISVGGKAAFKAVVLVEFPRRGAYSLGFVTGTTLSPEGLRLTRVFVPTAPNPTSGFLVLFPDGEVQYTDITVEEGIKTILSGGMLSPDRYRLASPPAAE